MFPRPPPISNGGDIDQATPVSCPWILRTEAGQRFNVTWRLASTTSFAAANSLYDGKCDTWMFTLRFSLTSYVSACTLTMYTSLLPEQQLSNNYVTTGVNCSGSSPPGITSMRYQRWTMDMGWVNLGSPMSWVGLMTWVKTQKATFPVIRSQSVYVSMDYQH